MQAAVVFEAENRMGSGKGEARALRRSGKVPAVAYGEGTENASFAISENQVTREYLRGGFFSKLIEIKVANDTFLALPKQIQKHPVSDAIEHVDFLRVTENSRVPVNVPVHFQNMDRCIGLKRGGALNIVRHTIELLCAVNAIPRSIDIDLLEVNIGDSIHISHVTLPEGVKPVIADRDFTVATITGRGSKDEDAAAAPAVSAADVPAKKQKEKDA